MLVCVFTGAAAFPCPADRAALFTIRNADPRHAAHIAGELRIAFDRVRRFCPNQVDCEPRHICWRDRDALRHFIERISQQIDDAARLVDEGLRQCSQLEARPWMDWPSMARQLSNTRRDAASICPGRCAAEIAQAALTFNDALDIVEPGLAARNLPIASARVISTPARALSANGLSTSSSCCAMALRTDDDHALWIERRPTAAMPPALTRPPRTRARRLRPCSLRELPRGFPTSGREERLSEPLPPMNQERAARQRRTAQWCQQTGPEPVFGSYSGPKPFAVNDIQKPRRRARYMSPHGVGAARAGNRRLLLHRLYLPHWPEPKYCCKARRAAAGPAT